MEVLRHIFFQFLGGFLILYLFSLPEKINRNREKKLKARYDELMKLYNECKDPVEQVRIWEETGEICKLIAKLHFH